MLSGVKSKMRMLGPIQDAEGGRIREVVGEEGRLRTKLGSPKLLLAYLFQRELPRIDKLQMIQQ